MNCYRQSIPSRLKLSKSNQYISFRVASSSLTYRHFIEHHGPHRTPPEDIEKRLKNPYRPGRTKAFYVKQAVLHHLEDLEDYFMAEKASEDFRAGGEKAIPLEEVMREYGLED